MLSGNLPRCMHGWAVRQYTHMSMETPEPGPSDMGATRPVPLPARASARKRADEDNGTNDGTVIPRTVIGKDREAARRAGAEDARCSHRTRITRRIEFSATIALLADLFHSYALFIRPILRCGYGRTDRLTGQSRHTWHLMIHATQQASDREATCQREESARFALYATYAQLLDTCGRRR